MSNELQNAQIRERWEAIAEPAWEINQAAFENFCQKHGRGRNVVNCAVPLPHAKALTDFQFPAGWDTDKCLIASLGRGKLPQGLEAWEYTPKIQAAPQLPQFKPLPPDYASLTRSPWFQTPSQASWMGINARHLRYHHQLWSDLKPKTLRGVQTTLVYVTPQIGFSLTPHIKLDKVFHSLAALSRSAGPAQLFPADFLYPDANLQEFQKAPAPIFSDILPFAGGINTPIIDETPDAWGTLARFEGPDYFYGYPFNRVENPVEDTTLRNWLVGGMVLPNGTQVRARNSESLVYATLDSKLKNELKQDRQSFQEDHCLVRGVVTHDGLPFQLPVEMQTAVFAIILTAWELEMDGPGDLTSYALKTQHAAIRGYNYYQKVEPYHSSFMRLVHEISKNSNFEVYPLASHLTHSWLGGNLRISNQLSESERALGPQFMRSYYQQQLDWSMGVFNLWNHVEFRKGGDPERNLAFDGLAFHQMRPQLQFDTLLYQRPLKRASLWPDLHPGWLEYDQTLRTKNLPRPSEC